VGWRLCIITCTRFLGGGQESKFPLEPGAGVRKHHTSSLFNSDVPDRSEPEVLREYYLAVRKRGNKTNTAEASE